MSRVPSNGMLRSAMSSRSGIWERISAVCLAVGVAGSDEGFALPIADPDMLGLLQLEVFGYDKPTTSEESACDETSVARKLETKTGGNVVEDRPSSEQCE